LVNRGNFARLSIRKPIFVPHWRHHRHHHWHVRWHRPWIYGVGTAAIAAPAYAAVATAKPCTCLTKEYTPDNVVIFKDLCTKEQAAAQLGGQQQSQAQPGAAAPQQ
jgi:hypothetical protein